MRTVSIKTTFLSQLTLVEDLGIGSWPLKRRRTRLSIPFGLRQEGLTDLYRSDWCRMNGFVRFLTIGTLLTERTMGKLWESGAEREPSTARMKRTAMAISEYFAELIWEAGKFN